MLERLKYWHAKLNKAGRTILYSVASIVLAGTAVGASNGSNSQQATVMPTNSLIQSTPVAEPEINETSITETVPIAFTTSSVNDANLEKGKTTIRTAGVNGIKTLTYKVLTQDGKQKSKELIKEEITSAPIEQITAIGTKESYVKPPVTRNCDPNYTPCVPNVTYDLDCGDISYSVEVTGSDPHRFDRDGDGYGCESN